MLVSYSQLLDSPVLSVHVSGQIANTVTGIIDPENLKLIAFVVQGPLITADTGDILDVSSIREYSHLGFVIDSIDNLSQRDDIMRVKKVIELDFSPIGLKVKTEKGKKVGKIIDLSIDINSFTVQQLIVKRPAMQSFVDPELIVGRREIVEINDDSIIIKDDHSKSSVTEPTEKASHEFVNPFREPEFSQSDSQSLDVPNTE